MILRALWVVVATGCAPPAQSIGGWTTEAADTSMPGTSSGGTSTPQTTESSSDGSGTSSSSSTDGGSSSTGAVVPRAWILAADAGAPATLRVRAMDDGASLELCAVDQPVDGLAFLDDGTLVASATATATLVQIDPCTCATTPYGPIRPPLALQAITELDGTNVLGADAMREALVTVDVSVPMVLEVLDFADAPTISALGFRDGTRYALRAGDPMHLLAIDDAGALLDDHALASITNAGGLTASPTDDGLLACRDDGALWHLDPTTGEVVALEPGIPGPCASLATPPGPVPCIDALLDP